MRYSTVVVGIALAAIPALCTAGDVFEFTGAQQERSGVEVETVGERDFGDTFRVIGEVQRAPGTTETVKSLVQGRVEQVLIAPGQQVAAGDPLLVLHSHGLLAAQHDLQRLADELELAKARLSAGERLLEVQGIAELEVESRRLRVRAAQRAFQAAGAELADLGMGAEAIGRVLDGDADPHLTLRANTSGVVLELAAQPHLWIEPYESLVVLGDAQRLELALQIPSDQADRVAAGDRVEFRPVGGSGGGVGMARVVSRVPEVDPETRTLRVRAVIEREVGGLFPGVFVEGDLQHGEPRKTLAIQKAAVIVVGGRDSVFVRRGEETFERVPISLGENDGDFVEVSAGLEPGDQVATNGVFLLKSAMMAAAGEE
jgi:cobalt-zinc-cadmium efflux system membrane fusion protein